MSIAQHQPFEGFKTATPEKSTELPALGAQLLCNPDAVRDAFSKKLPECSFLPLVSLRLGAEGPKESSGKQPESQPDPKDVAKEKEAVDKSVAAIKNSDFKAAEDSLKEVLELRKRIHGEKSREVLEAASTLGWVAEKNGNYKDARDYYKQAAKTSADVYGKDDRMTGVQIKDVARMDVELKNDKDAATNFKEALRIFEKADPIKHKNVSVSTIATLNDYAALLERNGDKDAAAAQRKRAQEIEDHWAPKKGPTSPIG